MSGSSLGITSDSSGSSSGGSSSSSSDNSGQSSEEMSILSFLLSATSDIHNNDATLLIGDALDIN